MSRRAAKRYAKAMIQLSQDNKNLDELYNQMQTIYSTLSSNKELKVVLRSPVIKNADKLAILTSVFAKSDQSIKELFKVLCDNHRVSSLGFVAEEFISIYKKLNNMQDAQVVTAIAMTKTVEAQVQDKIKSLTGYTATITNTIDASIMGGFILKINDMQLDASVQGSFNTLRREILN